MKETEARFSTLEAELGELGGDLRALRRLVVDDHQSALNKMRYVTEKVLHRLATEQGVGWGSGEPTLENMIGPLVAKKVIPRSVALHVRTVQTNASPGSHYQESALGKAHVQVAELALLEFLAWYREASRPAHEPEAMAARPASEGADIATYRTPPRASGSPPSRRFSPGALAAAGLVLALAGAAALVARRSQSPEPVEAASGVSSAPAAPALRAPEAGLEALARYRAPRGSEASNLASAPFWEAAARDFAEAEKQPGAPSRWAAAKHFSEGNLRYARGANAEAIAAFEKAIAIDLRWAPPRSALALVLARAGDTAAGLREAGEAQRIEPGWWVAVATGGRILAAAGRLDEAIPEYRRALALAPKDPVLLSELALVYHAARLDSEAERHARLALEADPDSVSARILLAERALERGDGAAALAEATRAVAVSPTSIPGNLALGDAFALGGREHEARAAYARALASWERTHARGAPEPRLAETRASLSEGKLPPPRGAPVSSASAPGSLRVPPARTRLNCSPGDPLCSAL